MQIIVDRKRIFSRTQVFFICFGVLSHLSIYFTVANFFNTGKWGYPRLGWIIPERAISIAGFQFSSNTLLSYHVLSSYCLYFGLLAQLCLMGIVRRTGLTIHVHRVIGSVLLLVALPAFVVFAATLDMTMARNPANRLLFGIIPVLVCYGMLAGFSGIRAGRRIQHIDGMFLAVILLNAAPTIRILTGILYASGVPIGWLIVDQEANPALAIARTILILAILAASYLSCGRLKQNRIPLYLLAAVVPCAVWLSI